MGAATGITSYEYAYRYEKFLSGDPNTVCNSLSLKIHINYLGSFSQLFITFKHLLNLTDKSLSSLSTPVVKTGQI